MSCICSIRSAASLWTSLALGLEAIDAKKRSRANLRTFSLSLDAWESGVSILGGSCLDILATQVGVSVASGLSSKVRRQLGRPNQLHGSLSVRLRFPLRPAGQHTPQVTCHIYRYGAMGGWETGEHVQQLASWVLCCARLTSIRAG